MLKWITYLNYATLQTSVSWDWKITLNTIKTDIVIIGGGIVGITTAYYLVKSGINCLVIEKDALGSHASGFAYGSIGASKLQGLNYPLALKGCSLHNELNEFLTRETNIDIQYRVKSSIKLAFNEEEKIILLALVLVLVFSCLVCHSEVLQLMTELEDGDMALVLLGH